MKRRQGRRRKQVLNNLKETKGNWRLKKEALGTMWRTRCQSGYGPLVREATDRLNDLLHELSLKSKTYYLPMYRDHKILFFSCNLKKNNVKYSMFLRNC